MLLQWSFLGLLIWCQTTVLLKLSNYGIQNKTLEWITSFLADNTQGVVVDEEQSDPAPLTSGVLQGSVLAPILFLVFINHMPECFTSKYKTANDTTVYCKIVSITGNKLFQQYKEALHKWEKKWEMFFKPTKCNAINSNTGTNILAKVVAKGNSILGFVQ